MELRLTRLTTQHSGIYSCSLQGDLSLLTLHTWNIIVQSRALCFAFAPAPGSPLRRPTKLVLVHLQLAKAQYKRFRACT